MIAATLIEANQNSNSPKDLTDHRFVAVSSTMRTRLMSHIGASIQRCRMVAPATASMARTIAQKYQYSQPTVKPARAPRALREYSTNYPTDGLATAISPSIRMTRTMRMPAAR